MWDVPRRWILHSVTSKHFAVMQCRGSFFIRVMLASQLCGANHGFLLPSHTIGDIQR